MQIKTRNIHAATYSSLWIVLEVQMRGENKDQQRARMHAPATERPLSIRQ
jgi:hypothetical protein